MFAGVILDVPIGAHYGVQSTPILSATNWTTLTNIFFYEDGWAYAGCVGVSRQLWKPRNENAWRPAKLVGKSVSGDLHKAACGLRPSLIS